MLTVDNTVIPAASKLLDVLPALLVSRARHVGVRQLVDDGNLRMARQDRIDVHLGELAPAVLHDRARNDLEIADQFGRVHAPVRFDNTDDDVGSPLCAAMCLAQHGERLAHPGSSAEVDAERATRAGQTTAPPVLTTRLVADYCDPDNRSRAILSPRTSTAGAPMNPNARPTVCWRTSLRDVVASRFRALATRGDLQLRIGHGDVRVEAARARSHGVSGHRVVTALAWPADEHQLARCGSRCRTSRR